MGINFKKAAQAWHTSPNFTKSLIHPCTVLGNSASQLCQPLIYHSRKTLHSATSPLSPNSLDTLLLIMTAYTKLDQNGPLHRISNHPLPNYSTTYTNINILQSVAQTHAAPLILPSIGKLNPELNPKTKMRKYRLFTICILKYFCGTNVEPHSYKIVHRIAAFATRMKAIVIVLFGKL